jgi:hypothetical protein
MTGAAVVDTSGAVRGRVGDMMMEGAECDCRKRVNIRETALMEMCNKTIVLQMSGRNRITVSNGMRGQSATTASREQSWSDSSPPSQWC